MNWFYLIFFLFSYQNAAQSEKPLLENDTHFFDPYLFEIFTGGNVNYSSCLSSLEAFDFKRTNDSFGQYHGVICCSNGTVRFLTRTTVPTDQNDAESLCSCKTQPPPCVNCAQFKTKLRKGLFYCGDYQLCRQDEKGTVFIEQYSEKGEKQSRRLLFVNFKRIMRVKKDENENIHFIIKSDAGHETDSLVVYNYQKDQKMRNVLFYPELKTFYETLYPWMAKTSLQHDDLKICDGDLVIETVVKPCWLSLFKKITFSNIIDCNKKFLFLRTESGDNVRFSSKEKRFYYIVKTPVYNSDDLSWMERSVEYRPISESFLGRHCGQYIVALRQLLVNLKNRFIAEKKFFYITIGVFGISSLVLLVKILKKSK
jgi:hypothetical protein